MDALGGSILITRLRSMVDVTSFIAKTEWVIVTSVASFLLGLLPTLVGLPREIGWGIAAVGVITGFLFVLRDAYGVMGRWSSWTMRKLQFPIPFPGEVEVPGLPTIVKMSAGSAAIDVNADARLRTATNRVRWESDEYRLPSDLAEKAPYVLRTSAMGRWPFNGPNVRLESDISVLSIDDGQDIVMRPAAFFPSLCSNELTGWSLTESGVPWKFREQFLFDTDGRIIPLSQSRLANGVGVSTLAITTDDKLLIVLQSMRTQTSSGMWAPSGSGALEPQDVGTQPNPLLTTVVTAGAVRELREEGLIRPEWIGESAVIGYARWLDRGAKPEFFCLTALTVDSSVIRRGSRAHRLGSEERMWTADIQTLDLDLSGILSSENKPGGSSPLWATTTLIPDQTILEASTSVSLSMALDAFVRALISDKTLLATLREAQVGLSVSTSD